MAENLNNFRVNLTIYIFPEQLNAKICNLIKLGFCKVRKLNFKDCPLITYHKNLSLESWTNSYQFFKTYNKYDRSKKTQKIVNFRS